MGKAGKAGRTALLGVGCLVLAGLTPTATAQTSTVSVIGFSNLGGGGANGSVAVSGNTAVVGSGFVPSNAAHASFYNPQGCPRGSVKVVDITNPANPTVLSTILAPPGQAALDPDILPVNTGSFTGMLVAIPFNACSAQGFASPAGINFYDVTNRSAPVFLGQFDGDDDYHEVELLQQPGGRVLALAPLPFNSGGDIVVIDATDPRHPVGISTYPDSGEPPFSSNNGCRAFAAGHSATPSADGTHMLAAYLDGGVFNADITNPAAPATVGRFAYPPDRDVEGQAGFAAYAGATRPLALVSEEDWIAPKSTLTVSTTGPAGGLKNACEAMFTLFDPQNNAAVFRKPNSTVAAEIVYLGRGCPDTGGGAPDPYLSDPAGKIAIVDRGVVPAYPGGVTPGNFCNFDARVRRAEAAGAMGVLIANSSTAAPLAADGSPDGISIPAYMFEKTDADALRPVVCPTVVAGHCADHRPVYGAMNDRPGSWGALKVLDLSNPAAPTQVSQYQTTRSRLFPPPDLGVYAPAKAVARGDIAYVAWNSDGLRVLDLSQAAAPREVGSFVPPDSPDPTGSIPAKSYVQSVEHVSCGKVAITDVNRGLYILSVPAPAGCLNT